MNTNHLKALDNGHQYSPIVANVDAQLALLNDLDDDVGFLERAAMGAGAVAFVHFDPSSAKSATVEALIHGNDLTKVHRGLYVTIVSIKDDRQYMGRVIEGPFFGPDALRRDSTPVQFIILNQGQGKALSLPEYHGWMQVEILGEVRSGSLYGATRRPHPASPVLAFDPAAMKEMLHLGGNIRLGLLDNYENVFVEIDGNDKGVVPRNWLTVGTIGSGKSNTNQVFIEETLAAGYAQIVVDPEGEYIQMDKPSTMAGISEESAPYARQPKGVGHITVYRPPRADSKREGAIEFSVPFESLAPEVITELVDMTTAQEFRFTFLYDQAIQLLKRRQKLAGQPVQEVLTENDDLDISRGYPGMTLALLIDMLNQEFDYYNWKREHAKNNNAASEKKKGKGRKPASANDLEEVSEGADEVEPELRIYCHDHKLLPLVDDQADAASYGALRKKLRELSMFGIFDRKDAPPLDMKKLSQPGHLSVLDMSDAQGQQIVNIVIADLLARMYHYKMGLTEDQNAKKRVFITIEEAHGFVSKDRENKMTQTLDQLRRIARRGRKRWLALHFVTQSPQHLPAELFELANNKIIHQTTGTENLKVLKAAAGSVNEGIWADVPSLGKGRAVIVSSQYPHPVIVRIRPAMSQRNYVT